MRGKGGRLRTNIEMVSVVASAKMAHGEGWIARDEFYRGGSESVGSDFSYRFSKFGDQL